MTELIELFRRAADGFSRHVHAVAETQWHLPTPVHRMGRADAGQPRRGRAAVGAAAGRGVDRRRHRRPPRRRPARRRSARDLGRGGARHRSPRSAAPGALDRTVSLSSGPRPTAEYCWEMTTDALIHSWDLARGIGADETMDAELVDVIYERTLPFVEQLQASGHVRAARAGSRRRPDADEVARDLRPARLAAAARRVQG